MNQAVSVKSKVTSGVVLIISIVISIIFISFWWVFLIKVSYNKVGVINTGYKIRVNSNSINDAEFIFPSHCGIKKIGYQLSMSEQYNVDGIDSMVRY